MGKETEGEATTTCAQSHHHDSLHLISNRKHKSLKYYVFLITEAQCCVHGIFKRKADVDCLNISKVILHINLFMRRFSLPSICSTLWFLPSPHTQSDLLSSPIKSAHLRWKTFSRTGDPRAALRSDRKTGNCWRCLCTVYRSGALKMHEVSSESVGKKKKKSSQMCFTGLPSLRNTSVQVEIRLQEQNVFLEWIYGILTCILQRERELFGEIWQELHTSIKNYVFTLGNKHIAEKDIHLCFIKIYIVFFSWCLLVKSESIPRFRSAETTTIFLLFAIPEYWKICGLFIGYVATFELVYWKV